MKATYPRLWHAYDKALLWLLLAFFAAHMANHLALLAGQAAHLAMMEALRAVYRLPLLEALLLWAILRQVLAGLRQMRRFGPRAARGRFRVLVWSGIVLIGFLAVHISAVMVARHGLGLDSNLFFGAAGLHVWPYALVMYPYYALAIAASFAHLGAVVWLRTRAARPGLANRVYLASLWVGAILAGVVCLAMGGVLSDIRIPDAYLATFP